jgi:predicted Ser/Thr protein kinase
MNNEDVILEFNYKNPLGTHRNPHKDRITKNFTIDMSKIADNAMEKTFNSYMKNVAAYVDKKKIVCPFTMIEMPLDENLMRSVERRVGINANQAHEYRKQIIIQMISSVDKGFEWKLDSNPRLHKAIQQLTWENINIGKYGK